ncbi:hypothetical protein Ddye_016080 [Dipteronia dyeriana]|uniref:F-box protein n=1 Tax=Dipteronia dyeriana TaxID=168575 RepID=A0AAD9U6S2_9ROSI|nr:hypothetical protein Ddye_016080 [Dipteronia dyeriana]
MEYRPREIILDILSRLPVTSLLLSKLVAKPGTNHLLVYMHSSHATENDPCLVLHCDHPIRNQLYSQELSALGKDDQWVNKISVPLLPEFKVVGSYQGLLYLCDSSAKDIVCVYNPYTGDYIELPKSRELHHQYPVYGFGFNQTTDKYMVIKAVYRTHLRGPHNRHSRISFFKQRFKFSL